MSKQSWNEAFPNPSSRFHERVMQTLSGLPDEKEKIVMKNHSKQWKRSLVFAAVACVVLATGALAFGKVNSWVGHTSNVPIYTSLPTEQEVVQEMGFVPQMLETFSNGYTFDNACVGESTAFDEAGNEIGQVKNLSMDYKNGTDTVSLELSDRVLEDLSQGTEAVESYQEIPLFYNADTYKFVPVEYEMTEQDLEDEASGKYVFSVGSEQVEVEQVQGLCWEQDGHRYMLLGMNSPLTQADLVQMAHELIDVK